MSIVIPTHNRFEKLTRLLDSIERSSFNTDEREIIVVLDNCSDGTFEKLKSRNDAIKLIKAPHVGPDQIFGANGSRALGAELARAPFLCFIDDDNIIDSDMLGTLVGALEQNENLGAVGPLMLRWPERSGIWCSGAEVTKLGRSKIRNDARLGTDGANSNALTKCDFIPNVFCTRKSILRAVPFDPLLFPHNNSEVDWGFRLQDVGYEIAISMQARDWHDIGYKSWTTRVSSSAFVRDHARSRIILRRKYEDRFWPRSFFWLLWFPLSSAYYLGRFARSGQGRRLCAGYLKGTVEGWRRAREM